jgi:hypothetical protein
MNSGSIFSITEPGGFLGQSALQAIDHFTLKSVKYISGMKSSIVKSQASGIDVDIHILDFEVL